MSPEDIMGKCVLTSLKKGLAMSTYSSCISQATTRPCSGRTKAWLNVLYPVYIPEKHKHRVHYQQLFWLFLQLEYEKKNNCIYWSILPISMVLLELISLARFAISWACSLATSMILHGSSRVFCSRKREKYFFIKRPLEWHSQIKQWW